MMRRQALGAAATCLAVLAGCFAGPVPAEGGVIGRNGHPLEGGPAPPYSSMDLNGTAVDLADHQGRPVLLHIWASWCIVCEFEEKPLKALHADYGGRVDFISVSIDAPGSEGRMREEAAEAPGLQWWDPQDAVRPTFQVSYQPVTIFIAADGTVDAVWQGQRSDRTTLRAHEDAARTVLDRLVAGSA